MAQHEVLVEESRSDQEGGGENKGTTSAPDWLKEAAIEDLLRPRWDGRLQLTDWLLVRTTIEIDTCLSSRPTED